MSVVAGSQQRIFSTIIHHTTGQPAQRSAPPPFNFATMPPPSMCTSTKLLLGTVLFQWMCISYLLLRQLSYETVLDDRAHEPQTLVMLPQKQTSQKESATSHSRNSPLFNGVAATLMLNNPKWFQRRYTMMIQNVLFNIPASWGIQIFYTAKGQSQFGLDISPGLTRLIETYPDRIVLTTIPPNIAKFNQKPKQLWTTEWVWENMLLVNSTDDSLNVLAFTGNGAICSNSRTTVSDILNLKLDYIGLPSKRNKEFGGDGSTHSLRNRNAMLDAIRYQKRVGKGHDGNERDDIFFLRTLTEMNKKEQDKKYRIATKDQTDLFGGIGPAMSKMTYDEWTNDTMKKEAERAGPPLVVSGTIPSLGNAARELMLDLCPELKVIFPSLHNPSCFGAHPNGEKCAESICALKANRKGGC